MCASAMRRYESDLRVHPPVRADQKVFTSYTSGRVIWLDCTTCGRAVPRIRNEHNGPCMALRTCPTCEQPAALVAFSLRDNASKPGRKSECGAACLNGQRSCDCRCLGRCHGAGRCSCGTARKSKEIGHG